MTGEHIKQGEGVYHVSGTRVSLDSIVYAFREGCSPESIREDFDGLSLNHVYGAIAFYLDRQADVDSYLTQWADLESRSTLPGDELCARLERAKQRQASIR